MLPAVALSYSQAVGAAIREQRLRRSLSQEDAAYASGVDRTHFGHIERATKSPTVETVRKIADALEVPPSSLLSRAEELLGAAR